LAIEDAWATMNQSAELTEICQLVAERLQKQGRRAVFAESCTAGLISSSLASVPGISKYLCGSTVTYRNATKTAWLGVPETQLRDPGPVSPSVARSMVEGVLRLTPEADCAVSITGHLGPESPPDLDGVVIIGLAVRDVGSQAVDITVYRHNLTTRDRVQRQHEATVVALRQLNQALRRIDSERTRTP
jgi:PncC family amidohydrolase